MYKLTPQKQNMHAKDDSKIETLLAMYALAERRRDSQIATIWETMKLITTIIAALATATIYFYRFVNIAKEPLFNSTYSIPYFNKSIEIEYRTLVILPVIMLFISIWAYYYAKRQYSRFLEIITWINKIAHHLNVRDKGESIYPCDDFAFLPDRWVDECPTSGETFIQKNMKFNLSNRNMYTDFTILFLLYGVIAAFLIWWNSNIVSLIKILIIVIIGRFVILWWNQQQSDSKDYEKQLRRIKKQLRYIKKELKYVEAKPEYAEKATKNAEIMLKYIKKTTKSIETTLNNIMKKNKTVTEKKKNFNQKKK